MTCHTRPVRPCPVCNATRTVAFSTMVLNRWTTEAVHCRSCGLLQLVDPRWLDEAYGPMLAAADTGVVERSIDVARRCGFLFARWFGSDAPLVDISGGNGLLTRLLRDRGFDCRWEDPFATNVLARGFEWSPGDRARGAVAIEVLEHVEDPLAFLRDIFDRTGTEAIFFTTTAYEGDLPPKDWWYYQFDIGQHITFVRRQTLEHIAGLLDARLLTKGPYHVMVRARRPAWPFALATSRFGPAVAWITNRRSRSRVIADSTALRNAAR
jgi:hypothetical protein